MKIHEYQAKAIFRQYGIPTPFGTACLSLSDAPTAIEAVSGDVRVVKAQIHAGGRGKGGGVKIAKNADEARQLAQEIFGMRLVTVQTGAGGQIVRRLLIEEGLDIADEMYMSIIVDRTNQQVVFMASSEGGVEIEKVAEETPENIHKMWVSPSVGIEQKAAYTLVEAIGVPASACNEAVDIVKKLYRLFTETDASLVEINPLIRTADNHIVALDAKVTFDDNALFRHPEYADLHDGDEDDPVEAEASQHDLSYIALDGNIGCMVNGAGLAMATMDIIKLYGGEPANFLDVGGGATAKKVAAAFKLMLKNDDIRAILINIFGGIMRCDVIAEGVIAAARDIQLSVPLVVRLEGTNVERGRALLADSGLPIITAATMADAAEKAVLAAKQQ